MGNNEEFSGGDGDGPETVTIYSNTDIIRGRERDHGRNKKRAKAGIYGIII